MPGEFFYKLDESKVVSWLSCKVPFFLKNKMNFKLKRLKYAQQAKKRTSGRLKNVNLARFASPRPVVGALPDAVENEPDQGLGFVEDFQTLGKNTFLTQTK